MARPKSFDQDEALDAATECFRRQGLNAASVRDLADQMGIAGPSLYNAFGCKRALFVQALERYVQCGMRTRFAELERRGAKAAILAFVAEFVERAVGCADQDGCLLVNTAMELDGSDAELAAQVMEYLGEIDAFLRQNLVCAIAGGEVSHETDAEQTAGMLLALLLGISVLARLGAGAAQIRSLASRALALLETPLSENTRS